MRRIRATRLAFDDVRAEFSLPDAFPPEVEAAAAAAADGAAAERRDARDLPLVTIDPPGSMDLDQALHVVPRGDGIRLSYAIADVGAFVALGSPIDAEARRRGQTVYVPDGRVPLHPTVLSEGAASLLPGVDRPAALWTIDVDGDGEMTAWRVERALVRSRARLDYATVQGWIDGGARLPEALAAFRRFGELRRAAAVRRGAIELDLPAQEVAPDGEDGWTLRLEAPAPADAWNAECSLATGHAAARMMLDAKVGLVRTLAAATPDSEARFRAAIAALGLEWPAGASAAELVEGLPDDARGLAARFAATRLLRGAGYLAFDGEAPEAAAAVHAGFGDVYAHATAPLRRLADRIATECCLAIAADREPSEELRAALPDARDRMAATNRIASGVEAACTAKIEAVVLAGRVGEEFGAAVTRGATTEDGRRRPAEIMLLDPPVTAKCDGEPEPGTLARVRLTAADPATREVRFEALATTA